MYLRFSYIYFLALRVDPSTLQILGRTSAELYLEPFFFSYFMSACCVYWYVLITNRII